MNKKTISLGIVCLLVTGGLLIFVDIGTQDAQATDVSGTVFDGSGGPWNLAGSPYIVIGSILVPAGETLTIEPGVEVKFDGFFNIMVEGNLTAVGTENEMINITSNSLTPAPRDWEHIQIDYSGHAEISYCNISYGEQAIWLYEGSNNLTNNNFTYNEWPINAYSGGNIFANNTLSNNTWGLGLLWSSGNNLTNNTMINNGIYLYGDQLEQWNSHYIDTSNKVNGKPVYYVTNQTGGTVPQDAGQIILANCTGMQIEDHVIANTTAAIQLGFCSSDNIIAHNNLSNNTLGILLDQSNSNTISNNTACFNTRGILIRYSDDNIVTDNNCSDSLGVGTWGSGIFLSDGTGNSIYNNTCVNNYRAGVELSFNADGNFIFENNCSYNRYGIMCFYASHNEWYNNTCNNNTAWGLYLNGDSINNTFKENSFISNDEYGMELRDGNTNTIFNNEINWNKIYGVYITVAANNNTITYNDINNNTDYGIILETPDNIIHHNNIANNNGSTDIYDPAKIQGFDDSINLWNTSDQGNWWADWTTPDIVAPFGIVDNPNLLDGGGMDFFPLTSPVDPTPPDITNLQPSDGVTIIVNITEIAANYTDPAGINENSVMLEVDDVDVTLDSSVMIDGISYTPLIAFADGTHTVNLSVADIYGNMALASWTFTVDTTPPQISNKLPLDGSVTSDNMTTINASYSDSSGIDISKVMLEVDDNDETSNATVTADNITYIPIAPLADGTHTVELWVVDNSGMTTAQLWTFTVDAIPPVIFNMLPVNGTVLTVNTTTIAANYTDASGINASSVVLKINDVDMTSSATVTSEGVSYTPATGMADGIHEIYLEVMNIYDNPANASWEFTIDTTAPQLTNIQPSDGSVTNDNTTSISANFTDLSGIDMGSIVLKVDGVDVTSSADVTADGISYTPSIPWTEGTHTFELLVNDTLSNQVGIFKDFTVDTILPETITDLTASDPTTDSINLTWTAPGDDGDSGTAAGYEVRYSTTGAITDANWNSATTYSQSWTPLTAGETETYTISGLDQDTQYWFAIRALDEISNSAEISNSPDTITLIIQTAPTVPENLELTWGDSYVHLTWEAPSSDGNSPITNYRIYRGQTSGSIPFLTEIGNVLMYNDTTATNGIRYYFKVSAVNAIDEGPLSGEVSAIPATIPSAPQNLQATAGNGYVDITWSTPSDNGGSAITNYRIYRNTTSGAETFLTQVGNVLHYNDTTVTNGIAYYYQVKAKNALGEGYMSSEVSATPTAPVNQPPTSTITSISSGATVKDTVEISGTADDTDGTVERVDMKIDDGNWFEISGTASWSYNLDTTTLSNGEHTIYIRSYDGENFSDESSISVQVDNPSPKEEKSIFEESWFFLLIVLIVVVIIIALLLALKGKKTPAEGEIGEEVEEQPEEIVSGEEAEELGEEQEEVYEGEEGYGEDEMAEGSDKKELSEKK